MRKAKPVSATSISLTQPIPDPIKQPLRYKIILPYLALAIILAVGVSLLVNRIVFDTVDERFKNQLIETAKIASEITVMRENKSLETLRLIANTQGVSDAIIAGDAETLRTLTYGITVNARTEAVEFLNASGQLIFSMRHIEGGNIEEYLFLQGGDASMAEWPFVQKVLMSRVDNEGDKYAGVMETDWGKYLYVAGPVFTADNQLAGVVLVGHSLPSMVTEIRAQTLAQVTLYDLNGKLQHSSLLTPQSVPAETAADVLASQDVSSLDRQMGERSLFSSNVHYEEILKPWELRNGEDVGLMGLALPKTIFIKASSLTRLQVFAVLLLVILMVILVGNRLASSISRPVTRLVNAATQVSRGNLQVNIPITTEDEVAVLGHSFNRMVQNIYNSQKNLVEAYDSTLLGWSRALELRDEETEGHTMRVTKLAVDLASEIGIQNDELENIRRGAILHDIGKMAISDKVLRKPGPLTTEEREIIKKHPLYAYEMLKDISFLQAALNIPLYHHERWDGTGYPKGLKEREIPIDARIFAIVDVWDAMSHDRVYHKAIPTDEVQVYIQQGAGSHFDPELVEVFLRMMQREED